MDRISAALATMIFTTGFSGTKNTMPTSARIVMVFLSIFMAFHVTVVGGLTPG